MTLIACFIGGLLLGVLAEQVWHRTRDRPTPSRSVDAMAGDAGPPRRRRRGRRIAAFSLVALVVLGLIVAGSGYLYARSQFNRIEKVPVGEELVGGSDGTNYLLVGTDNRPGVAGNRSDTILVLRTVGDTSTIMSIPRDLLVTIPGRDGEHRINAAYSDGPAQLIRTVQQTLRVPIDRYVEINFVSFGGLVDALGGVTIDFPFPASDSKSGLDIARAGPQRLNGDQALAYVRSRTYTEIKDGRPVTDPTADLGRVQRQQTFLRTVLGEAGRSRNPFKLAEIGRSLRKGLKIDDDMTLVDALRFARNMGRFDPETVVPPTTATRTSGGASVLVLQDPAAGAVLGLFRS